MQKQEYSQSLYSEDYAQKLIEGVSYPYNRVKNLLLATAIQKRNAGLIIDIGSGINGSMEDGLKTYLPPPIRRRYVALDINHSVLLKAEKGVVGDSHRLPLSRYSADTVIMADSLEHFLDPKQALCEARRILKLNGALMLVYPTMYKLNQFPNLVTELKAKSSHVNFLPPHELLNKIRETGFEVQSIRGIDYWTGFLYLLFVNDIFIPNNETDQYSCWANVFLKIKHLIWDLPNATGILNEIDQRMNDEENHISIVRPFLTGKTHPLRIIVDLLHLSNCCPAYIQEQINHQIDSLFKIFDPNQITKLLRNIPPYFRANSVFITAQPK
jgi:SAM-dependent methyltransferase